jgi:short-subunit dehydrogenase
VKITNTHTLVTGGSHGIGVDIAREFAARGGRITVLGRNAERLRRVAAEIGGDTFVLDLEDVDAVSRAGAEVESMCGPIDILVNNAGLAQVSPIDTSAPGDAQRLMGVNTVAPIELTRQLLPGMLRRDRGRIVNVSSLAGVSAVPDMAVYGASKAALHHFTAGVQRELRHRRARVGMTLVTLGEVAGTQMMEDARQSPNIAAVSARLARTRALPDLSTVQVAKEIADAVERDADFVSIPRRVSAMIGLRNLPTRIQDLALIGLKADLSPPGT